MKNKKFIFIAIPLVLGGILVSMIAKANKGKSKGKSKDNQSSDENVTDCSNLDKYIVTAKSGLNIRKEASASSEKLGALESGSTLSAKPATTSGWLEYYDESCNLIGYVSSKYTKKQ
jgi:uncharacterized protein YgiM (DUF1202 family)